MKRFILIINVVIVSCFAMSALSPIKWSASYKMLDEQEGIIILKADIENGWHLYGIELPKGGPKPTTFDFGASVGVKMLGEIKPSAEPIEKLDDIFRLKLCWWDSSVTFMQRFAIEKNNEYKINVEIEYMGCNEHSCLPPSRKKLSLEIKGK